MAVGPHIGPGRRRRNAAGGGGAPALLPVHSRVVFYGDGICSEGASPGMSNAPTQFLRMMNGRLRGAVGWMQCKSGGDMETTYARRSYTIGQQAPLVVITSMGHNPEPEAITLLNTDPAVNPLLINRWKRNAQAIFDGCPNSIIIISTTVASDQTELHRAAVWTEQRNFIAGLGPRANLWDTDAGGFAFASMTHDGTHPNQTGGSNLAASLFAVGNPLVETASRDSILGTTAAPAASGEWGASLDADWALSGTTGTKAGTIPPTGNYATGKRITNNLTNGTAVAVALSQTAVGSYTLQGADVSGTPAAAATITQDDTGNLSLTESAPGTFFELLTELIVDDGAGGAPVGLRGWSFGLGSLGSMGNSGNVANQQADVASAIDNLIRVPAKPNFGGTYPAVANPALATRWSPVALDGRTRISRPILRRTEIVAYAVPVNVGRDTIQGANFQPRITGTVGGTNVLRGEPGNWSGGGLTFDPKWYLNGVETASGWTYTQASPASGTVIAFRACPTNSFGSDLADEVTVTVP